VDAVSVYDELEAIVAKKRWEDLRPLLLPPPDSDIGKEVRRWYRSRRAYWNREYDVEGWIRPGERSGRDAMRVLAIAILEPARAVKEIARPFWGWSGSPADALMVELAIARGPEFCQAFLHEATTRKYSKEDNPGWIARLATPMVISAHATIPPGPVFGQAWAVNQAWGPIRAAWFDYQRHEKQYDGKGPAPVAPDKTLVDSLRDDPLLADGFSAAIASPNALSEFETRAEAGWWALAPAVAQLVDEGRLDRERVMGDVLEALTRQDTAHTQRALAKLLTALELSTRDIAGRMPLIQNLLATARGSVTAALLPAVIDAADSDDIVSIAATVFARPEKAQRSTLLKALVSDVAPWKPEALAQALSFAADLPDQALANRAAKALAVLGVEATEAAQVPVDDLWADLPIVDEPEPAQVIAPDEASITAALSRMVVSMDAGDGAMFWDAAVRWAKADLRAARGWAEAVDDRIGEFSRPYGFYGLRGRSRVTVESHRELCKAVETHHTGVRGVSSWAISSRSISQILHDVFASETQLRLGEIPYLVSTPTRSNGALDFAALVERLRGYAAQRVGPLDLFVALTRLEPTDPALVTELDGISVELWSPDRSPGKGLFRKRTPVDAVAIVRRWVSGGGLPALEVSHEGGKVGIAPPELPVPPSTFGGLPPSLELGHVDGVHDEYADYMLGVETDAGMLPGWADLLTAKLQRSFDQKSRFPPRMLPTVAASPSPGPAVTHVVAATLSHTDEDWRLLAVDAALTLIGRGRWDPVDYTTCCAHMLSDGELRLARIAHSWEQLILAGALKPLWPTALMVLERACAMERKPAGLAELLGMLRRYVAAVPDLVVPASVVALAGSKGSTKARAEAAAFVEAAS